jgi:hypothetical protein
VDLNQMTYEEYKKWLNMKTALEAAEKTDCQYYKLAVAMLYRKPVPPYPRMDEREFKDNKI